MTIKALAYIYNMAYYNLLKVAWVNPLTAGAEYIRVFIFY